MAGKFSRKKQEPGASWVLGVVLIALLLAAVLCLSLAACDNGKTENTDHSQGQNTENTSNENQQTETASQGNGNTEC